MYLDPNPVSEFPVLPVYETNTPNISWTSGAGMVDKYVLTLAAISTNTSFTNTTNDTMFEANLEYGEKYRIEIIAVFRELNSSPVTNTTIISNFFVFYYYMLKIYLFSRLF